MNTPESESSRSEPSGLQVELGAKPRSHLRTIWLVPLLVFFAVGSVTLLASLPKSSPTPSLAPSVAAQPSPQPKITWSENQLEVILSPGESFSRDLTFTSSLNIQNIVVEPVPAIAPFVTIQPKSLANVPAGQPQSAHLAFSIPPSATLGTYTGTIHVRSGSQTLPQTAKITLRVWATVADTSTFFQIKHPHDWTTLTGFSPYNSRVKPGVKIFVLTITSPQGSQLHILPEGEFDYGIDISKAISFPIVLGGHSATRLDFFDNQQQLQFSRIKFIDLHDFRIEVWPKISSDISTLEAILSTLTVY